MTRRRPLHAALGVLLAVLSAALWQWRFERVAPAMDLRIGADFGGWTLLAAERFQQDVATWTLLAPSGKRVASAEGRLPGLEHARYLHVGLDAAWRNVTRREGRSWWTARVSLGGRMPDGSYVWPPDGDLVNARGSRGWHRYEYVLDLPPGMGDPRLFINNLAAGGTLSVRNLVVTPVRQRPWVAAAAAVLVIGWAVWMAGLIGRDRGWLRQAASSAVVVAAGWFLVFPQPHYHARPFPGGFALGGGIPPPPAAAAPLAPAPPAAPAAVVPPAPAAQSETRARAPLVAAFRRIDRAWRFAHVAAFCLLGLALFSLAGMRHTWRIAAALALMSEAIPNLLGRDFHADDAVDLVANFAGLGLAALLWHGAARIRQRARRPEN